MSKMNYQPQKVFGIGLNKTGTSTLGMCLKKLGYRCTSCSRELLHDVVINKDFQAVKETVQQYDGFEDWPWPIIYKELDELFPGSKFILTTRKNSQAWLKSLTKYSMRTRPFHHCRKLAYGFNYPQFKQREHLAFYENHNDQVRNYFSGREEDFIELCWENMGGWQGLCEFLDKPIPPEPLPHINANKNKRVKKYRFLLNYILLHLRF